MNKEKELEIINNHILLRRKNGESTLQLYIRYEENIKHLINLGYDISELETLKDVKDVKISW